MPQFPGVQGKRVERAELKYFLFLGEGRGLEEGSQVLGRRHLGPGYAEEELWPMPVLTTGL